MGKAEDRISNLPDAILHHILSFLESKIVARTGVLSHRWKYIWTSIPNLNFVFEGQSESKHLCKFMNFVDGTLHRHSLTSSIQKFYLTSSEHLDESRVNSWISNVIKYKVKKLSLFLHQADPLSLPLSVFSCESLTSLKLQTHPIIRFPKCFTFPRLKRLELHNFEFSNDCWNEKLFSDSPVLEELCLYSCSYHLCISVPRLKLLRITFGNSGLQDCVLKIHTPSLETLFYSGGVAKEYILSSFFTLEEAFVYFEGKDEDETNEQRICREEATSQFLRALTHVEYLTVYDTTLQAICFADERLNHLPTFQNVKHLEVFDVPNGDKALLALLKVTPNLESLVFDTLNIDDSESDTDDEGEENHDEEVNSVESGENHVSKNEGDTVDTAGEDGETTGSLFTHLKSVRFERYCGNPEEMWWVKQTLRNAKALQSMTIFPDFSIPATVPYERLMEIPNFSRAAANCLFTFCFWRNRKWENLEIRSSKDS